MTPGLLRSDIPIICFAAHPDDETIGAGGQLPFFRNAWIVHATDGAPRNMDDAYAHGFATREAYADARRREFLAAMQLCGLRAERSLTLGFVDQECSIHIAELASDIVALLRDLEPQIVLVPPYEGGHPDHDSLAFAAHLASRILLRNKRRGPRFVEHALYHGNSGQFTPHDFIDSSGAEVLTIPLSEPVATVKRKMLECFVTQKATLAGFSTEYERFRFTPVYDFTSPPHDGSLYYERFNWGIDGEGWRKNAIEAARRLEVKLS